LPDFPKVPVRVVPEQTILITGATDRLGRALAIDLARAGATLLLHGRDDAPRPGNLGGDPRADRQRQAAPVPRQPLRS
jgi:NAD(P)-dependent dehydrogenase (short-subunit alcohol dehydrogenase family)